MRRPRLSSINRRDADRLGAAVKACSDVADKCRGLEFATGDSLYRDAARKLADAAQIIAEADSALYRHSRRA